jgi:predicted transporter
VHLLQHWQPQQQWQLVRVLLVLLAVKCPVHLAAVRPVLLLLQQEIAALGATVRATVVCLISMGSCRGAAQGEICSSSSSSRSPADMALLVTLIRCSLVRLT